jgi:hypothetical protein
MASDELVHAGPDLLQRARLLPRQPYARATAPTSGVRITEDRASSFLDTNFWYSAPSQPCAPSPGEFPRLKRHHSRVCFQFSSWLGGLDDHDRVNSQSVPRLLPTSSGSSGSSMVQPLTPTCVSFAGDQVERAERPCAVLCSNARRELDDQGCRILSSVAHGDAARERIRSWRVHVAECFWVYPCNGVFANEFV